ncbi:MAG TPA: DUF3530 family protein [Sedimenticola thiotaurini]|uniref:DUF3530 family protein n=1 Tax=Sedimenticola thiotaurini TaxID=1543721 RepID=A0A831RQE5_9GAMM|nr:DUF3530 family protein [Sedimenticola thiotaurini]
MKWFQILFLLLGASVVQASDLAREQRIVAEIEEAVVVGEPLRLQAGGLEFFAIHAEAERPDVRGGVIILHGYNANPTWADVVQPLRSELPAAGWETLALQLPVTAADAPRGAAARLIPESFPRIDAAVTFFRDRGIVNLVLVGHSLGARMALEYLAARKPREIRALVAVGLPAGRDRQRGTLAALANLRLPVLDIYGSRDLDAVRGTAPLRAAAARRAGNGDYRQVEVAGADHFFRGLDETLVARVRSWIARMAPGYQPK